MLFEKQFDIKVNEKLSELKELQEAKANSLAKKLFDSEEQRNDLEEKYRILNKDFAHNLQILEERDEIIDSMKGAFDEIKSIIISKNKTIEEQEEIIKNSKLELSDVIEELKFELRESYDRISDFKQEHKNSEKENREKIKNLQIEIQNHKMKGKLESDEFEQLKVISKNYENLTKQNNDNEIQLKSLTNLNEKLSSDLKRFRENEQILNDKLLLEKEVSLKKFDSANQIWMEKEIQLNKKCQDLEYALQNIKNEQSQLNKELEIYKSNKGSSEDYFKGRLLELENEISILKEKKAQMKKKQLYETENFKQKENTLMIQFSTEKELLKNRIQELQKKSEFELERIKINENRLNEKIANLDLNTANMINSYEKKIDEIKMIHENEKRELKNQIEKYYNDINSLVSSKNEIQRKYDQNSNNVKQFGHQIQEFEKENQLLMQEIIELRKNSNAIDFKKQDIKTKSSPNKGGFANKLFLGEFSEKESIDEAFSGDLGPASPLKYSKIDSKKKVSLLNMTESSRMTYSQLRTLVRDLQEENEKQKAFIIQMQKDMEESKSIVKSIQEKNNDLNLKGKEHQDNIFKLQNEIIEWKNKHFQLLEESKLLSENLKLMRNINEVQIDSSNENKTEIERLREKLNLLEGLLSEKQTELDKITKERDKLIEISSSLKAKLNRSDNSSNLERIDWLEKEIKVISNSKKESEAFMEEEIMKWRFISQKKDEAIQKIKINLNQFGNISAAQIQNENNNRIDNELILEEKSFQESWNDFINNFEEIEKSLEMIHSKQLKENLEKEIKDKSINQSNNPFQEKCMKKNLIQKVRNYNIRDDKM